MRTVYNKNDAYRAFAVAVFAALGAQILLSFVFLPFADENGNLSDTACWIMQALYTALIGLSAFAYAAFTKTDFWKAAALNVKPSAAHTLWGIAIDVFLVVCMIPVNEWLMTAIEAAGLPRPSVDLPMQIFPLILVGSLLPAVTEEAVFRGTVAQGLAGGGVWKASLISGALFALFHMNPAQTVHQFLFGALLAALALRSGSTWTASIVHLFNNLTAVALSFVPIPDDLYAKMLLPAFFVGAAGAALCFFGYVKTTRSRQYEKEEALLSSNALVLFVVALLVCAALWVFSLVAE